MPAFGYDLRHKIDVRIDSWFANGPQRRKAWIYFVGHIIGLFPFYVLALPFMALEGVALGPLLL